MESVDCPETSERNFHSTLRRVPSSRVKQITWPMNTGFVGCPETSERNFHSTLRRVPSLRVKQITWPMNTGFVGCPETSERNYHSTLRRVPSLRAKQITWPMNMGFVGYPETSELNYHSTLHKIPEVRRSAARTSLKTSAALPERFCTHLNRGYDETVCPSCFSHDKLSPPSPTAAVPKLSLFTAPYCFSDFFRRP